MIPSGRVNDHGSIATSTLDLPHTETQSNTSPGYRSSIIFNDNSESNVVVPFNERTLNGNVHFKVASARALGPITEVGGDGIPSTPVPADCQTFGSDNCEDGKTINDDLANDGFTNYALGFSSNNETTEFTAMRVTIDTLGIDSVEVLRNPDPNQDGSEPTGVEATDWDENDTSSNYFINPNPGDLSGNIGYLLHLSGAHNDGGPRYDKIRIADTWQDLLHGGAINGWAGPSGDYNSAASWVPEGVPNAGGSRSAAGRLSPSDRWMPTCWSAAINA